MRIPSSAWAACTLALVAGPVMAQTAATPTGPVSSTAPVSSTSPAPASASVMDAFHTAEDGVDPSLRGRVVSAYGTGSPVAIDKWYFIFLDPSVASHGRVVVVQNNQIAKSYPADGGVVYPDALAFDPARVVSEGPALAAAQTYAAQHSLAYDHVRALLRSTDGSPDFRWRIQLLDGTQSKGFVFVSATDGSFALYSPPGTVHTSSASVEGQAVQAGNDVKNTFLGIGGDLQQFFTGQRTVDR